MKKLLALTALLALCAGCKLPHSAAIRPEYYAAQVTRVKARWHAGKVTTSATQARLADLDERVGLWVDDHYVTDKQKALLASAKR